MTWPFKSRREGLTLVELIVVFGITTMLSAIIILYGTSGRDQTIISVEVVKISQIIARAKSLSVSTQGGNSSICGYGVKFDIPGGRYSIVSYNDVDVPSCESFTTEPQIANTTVLQSYALPGNIEFRDVGGNYPANQILSVYFLPPEPRTFSNLNASGFGEARTGLVYLRTKSATEHREVTVNGSGQITY